MPRKTPKIGANRAQKRAENAMSFTTLVSIQAAENGSKQRRFRLNAYSGEPIRVYRYDLPVVVDVAGMDLSEQRIPALYDHMPYESYIVGQI